MIGKSNSRSRNNLVNDSFDSNLDKSSSFLKSFQIKHQEKSLISLKLLSFKQKSKETKLLDTTLSKSKPRPNMIRAYSKPNLAPVLKQQKLQKVEIQKSQQVHKQTAELYFKKIKGLPLADKRISHCTSNPNIVKKKESIPLDQSLKMVFTRHRSSFNSSKEEQSAYQTRNFRTQLFDKLQKRNSQDVVRQNLIKSISSKNITNQSESPNKYMKPNPLNSKFVTSNDAQSTSFSYEIQPHVYKTFISEESYLSNMGGQKKVKYVMIDLMQKDNPESKQKQQLKEITSRVQQALQRQRKYIQRLKEDLNRSEEENRMLKKELEMIKGQDAQ